MNKKVEGIDYNRYEGAAEVFEGQPRERSFFIGALAVRDQIIYPRAFQAANNLREDVYTKVSNTDPSLVFDEYDKHAAHMAIIDGREEQAKILYTLRVIMHDGDDSDDMGLHFEEYIGKEDYLDGEGLSDKRGEVGRFVSMSALENHMAKRSAVEKTLWRVNPDRYRILAAKAILYAKIMNDHGDYPGYGHLAEDLYAPLRDMGIAKRISIGRVCDSPNDGKERFVIKFGDDAKEKILNKIPLIWRPTELELGDDFYKIGGKRKK